MERRGKRDAKESGTAGQLVRAKSPSLSPRLLTMSPRLTGPYISLTLPPTPFHHCPLTMYAQLVMMTSAP